MCLNNFVDPRKVLNELDRVASDECYIYFSLPNVDDFYKNSLRSAERKKYLEFMYHVAHPYYYSVDTFSRIISGSKWNVDSISTIQDYSVLNYFTWYINGLKSDEIESATQVDADIGFVNDFFISYLESINMGNNISVVLTKKN